MHRRDEARAKAVLGQSRGLRILRALHASASLRAAATMGAGGVAFALGSLLLARSMPPAEYGLVLLFIGLIAVGGFCAPLGLDVVVGRRGLKLDPPWRRATLGACVAVGVATATVAGAVYRLPLPLVICAAIATVSMGAKQACAAYLQGQRQFGPASSLLQLANGAFLAVALTSLIVGFQGAAAPCLLMTTALIVGVSAVWLRIRRGQRVAAAQPAPGTLLREALSLVTLQSASAIFLQLERLLLAPLVGVHGLAMFGVLAVLVGSPFRMLQQAAQFTLIPSLRVAPGVGDRVRLLRREILLVSLVGAGASVVIWVAAPALAHDWLAGHYDLTRALIGVGLLSGALKVCSAFSLGTVIALGEERHLRAVNVISWGALALSVGAGFAAVPWGLVGVLYGIALGWLVRVVAAACIAVACVRRRGPLPDAAPRSARGSLAGHG